jgi:hypothetical protein
MDLQLHVTNTADKTIIPGSCYSADLQHFPFVQIYAHILPIVTQVRYGFPW